MVATSWYEYAEYLIQLMQIGVEKQIDDRHQRGENQDEYGNEDLMRNPSTQANNASDRRVHHPILPSPTMEMLSQWHRRYPGA